MEMSLIQRKLAWIFVIIGVVLIAVCVVFWSIPGIPEEFKGETQATIVDIAFGSTMRTAGSSQTSMKVLIGYEVDGQEYKRALGYHTSDMYTGQKIDIQYDTREPGVINVPGVRVLWTAILGGIGIVFAGMGVVLLKVRNVPIRVNGQRVQ